MARCLEYWAWESWAAKSSGRAYASSEATDHLKKLPEGGALRDRLTAKLDSVLCNFLVGFVLRVRF